MARVGVIRNFTVGRDANGKPTAWFDAYYDDGASVPVTVTGAQILAFLDAAGVFTHANACDGLPVILRSTDSGLVYDHLATF